MLRIFKNDGQFIELSPADLPFIDLGKILWIDLINPDTEERQAVETLHRQQLPAPDELEEIEASARFYQDGDGLHIHSLFLHEFEGRPQNITVACTLSRGRLITLRDREIPEFRLLRMQMRRHPLEDKEAAAILVRLFESKVEKLANQLEDIYSQLEKVSYTVLEEAESDLEEAINEMSRQEDLNGKIRLCLMDTQRALRFLLRHGRLDRKFDEQVRDVLRDSDSLLTHTSFLFEKVNFLMDAAQGFINIEQNQIIKTFSIAAVVFLPPTLIASIYGMNFQHMPELDERWAYPAAIALMVISGFAPYWFFKRRGWL